ncbi:hypothetical protein P3X46_008698 [Hevea brasiliensis]|uniref:Uncharacterized protein n=1 Tax=Hevea brasiliensis TaxID=3981 RepID=A0ABQ9MNJ8_HEVBR|nr:hypothetical protein P3X46_008698 [Hevea brasiliensis]
MDQCSLQSSSAEQYVTLEIPPQLIPRWRQEGFSYLHFGAVRLILSLHGRRGLPVTARVSLLDTRFLQYEHAVIGTCLTTLHAGSVVLTFFPNYNLSLRDPHLSTALKVQIQLTGAAQVTSSMMATQLPRNELEQLIPKDWLTNYERLHSTSQPIQITESSFKRNPDGTVQTSFQPPRHSIGSLPVFQTMMVQPLEKEQDNYPVGAVTPENHYIYPQKIDGHCPWDLPGSGACDEYCDCRDNYWENEYDHPLSDKNWRKLAKQTRRASCKSQQVLRRDYPDSSPWIGIHEETKQKKPLPIYELALEIIRKEGKKLPPLKPVSSPPTSLPLVQPCMMFSPTSYEADFPPLAQQTDQQTKISTRPFIHSTKVDSEGQTTPITQAEEVLNWQTKNAAVQNKALQCIDSKIDQVLTRTQHVDQKIDSFTAFAQNMYKDLQSRITQL